MRSPIVVEDLAWVKQYDHVGMGKDNSGTDQFWSIVNVLIYVSIYACLKLPVTPDQPKGL